MRTDIRRGVTEAIHMWHKPQRLLFETPMRGGGLLQSGYAAVHLHRSRKLYRARDSDLVTVEAVNGTNVKRPE